MKKQTISIIVALIVVAIIAVFITDYLSKRPDKLGANPYAYNMDDYKDVAEELIHYKETRNFLVKDYKPTGIDVRDEKIWMIGEGVLQAIATNGVQEFRVETAPGSECIEVTSLAIYVGFEDHIKKYTREGKLISEWDVPGRNCVFTSIAAGSDLLYVADAGNRRVLKYDFEGGLKGEFSGQAESSAGHGFIVPSANFDLLVNASGELWVVNPGKHAIENYSDDGKMLKYWQKISMKIDGFVGCCNPAEFTVLPDGSFVTSEKGMVRIKIYDALGEMVSVVAAPEKFEAEGHAPEVVADENGVIYALDFDRSMIRVFEKI